MPVPVGQIAVFAAITVPYIVLLTVFGLPFNHNLFWLYVLPPGLLTWLATRPVLESKRLPELLTSQARYLGEPRTWCRMAPLAEKDDVVVFGRVWRRAVQVGSEAVEPAAVSAQSAPAVASRARRPIAAPAAQRGRMPAELPAAGRRARPVTGSARTRDVIRAPGHPAAARDAASAGRPEQVREPGRAGHVPARGGVVPAGYPEPGRAGQVPARGGVVPTGYPEPGRAGHVPAR